MLKHADLTSKIISAFYTVYNELGYGFLEKVYENAMVIELEKLGLQARKQQPIKVHYNGEIIGEYFADILVEDKVILELKVAEEIHDAHLAQLKNYLRATDCEIGFVFNFGPEPEFKRSIFENSRKKIRKNQ